MTETAKTLDLKKYCLMLYVLYAVSALLQVSDDFILLSLSLLTLGVAGHLSKKKEGAAKGTPYESHLRWLYRTAWIASCVAIPVNLVLSGWLVWAFTDIGPLMQSAMGSGDPDNVVSGLQNYMDTNMGKVALFNAIGAAPSTIWWLHRCWRGYVLLKTGTPVDHFKSWL